jgi:3-hydroxyacyl-[acyl-carrier-protein] dehydratase
MNLKNSWEREQKMSENILPGPVEANEIQKFLPHRYPFLLIDRVLSMETEPEKRLVGVKNVSINEPFFNGHFPGNAIMPGVLIIESMAQAAGMLANLDAELHGKRGTLYYLVKVDNARFSKTVVPGDQLTLDVVQKRIIRNMGQYQCKAFVDGQRVASCEILCAGR